MMNTDHKAPGPRTCASSSCWVRNADVLTLMLALAGSFSAWGANPVKDHSHSQCVILEHSHAAWTQVLQDYVQDGRVDYAGLKKTGEPALNASDPQAENPLLACTDVLKSKMGFLIYAELN